MNYKKYKKLSFFSALAILLGCVVGIGIFFKNSSILKENNYNGWGTIISWVIGGILAMSTAIPFSEMGSYKTKDVHGLPGWGEAFLGKKIGRFILVNYATFYWGLLSVILSYFLAESVINIFVMIMGVTHPNVLITFILSVVFFMFVLVINYVSLNSGVWVQKITTILKFIPLIAVIFLGIGLVTTNNIPNPSAHSGVDLFGKHSGKFSISGVLIALPMVLFSFDAFLGVGSLAEKTKNGIKRVPIIIILGMLMITVLYLLITISEILHGVGMVSGGPMGAPGLGLFGQIFSPNVAKIMGILTMSFIAISVYGVINGMSMAFIETMEQSIEIDAFIGSKKLKKKYGNKKSVLIYIMGIWFFWESIILISLIFLKSDAIVDAISNLPTLFFFIVYVTVIFGYARKRSQLNTKKINNVLFNITVYIAIIGVVGVVGYQILYAYTVDAIMHPTQTWSFGLFNTPYSLKKWQFLVYIVVWISLFFAIPSLNTFLIKRYRKV